LIFKENELENIIEDETRKQWQLTHKNLVLKDFILIHLLNVNILVLRNIKQKKSMRS